jgi:hypothetical protein
MIKPLKMLTYFLLLPYMLPQKHHNLQQSYKVQGIKKQYVRNTSRQKMDSPIVHRIWLGAVKPISGDLCIFHPFIFSLFLFFMKNLK